MRRAVFPLGILLALAIGFVAGRLSVPLMARSSRLPECNVTGVIDGDTLIANYLASVPTTESVRLLNVDTPEKGEPGYEEATEALSKLVEGKQVRLEFETPGKLERDRYGRILAYVLADGVNVNVELVRQGWSPFYTKYGEGRYADEFRAAEQEARAAGRGMWPQPGNTNANTTRLP